MSLDLAQLSAALGDVGDPRQVNILTTPTAYCGCVVTHTPKVVVFHLHHVFPLGLGGSDTDENLLLLCPTGHATVHKLLAMYARYEGAPPWDVLRHANGYLRAVAEQGWTLAQTAF